MRVGPVIRAVRVQPCPRCGAKTLAGLDADWLALDTFLDHAPVDELGEALAVLQGRRTFDLRPTGGRSHSRCMEERSASSIRAGRRYHPVHAEHRCGQPLPAAPAKAATVHDEPDPSYRHPEGIPF